MATHTSIQRLINQNYLRYHEPHHFVTQGKNVVLPISLRAKHVSYMQNNREDD